MPHFTRFSLLALGLLTACAEPEMAAPVGEREAQLSCEDLAKEFQAAQGIEKAARADDRAKASYLLIVPAYVSWYRMEQAEDAARLRQQQLLEQMQVKNCPPLEGATLPSPPVPATPAAEAAAPPAGRP
jgi:hypothetical protein